MMIATCVFVAMICMSIGRLARREIRAIDVPSSKQISSKQIVLALIYAVLRLTTLVLTFYAGMLAGAGS